uniref:Glycolipid transfer protein domain-containing protein n=1 Tax=Vannella robusta TaxID=1487602 RepID=A0A7S4MH17_9EUKA|mmetsp:Transcript_21893/g.27942  ORF Transcript_21893/g.27942 Transcript_21893/m.27942 type:complete len:281 (+) Transcript_21893:314-1156(+)
MLSWWKKEKTPSIEPEKLSIRDIRQNFESLLETADDYDTARFIHAVRSVIEITGDFGSSWKFALTDVMENVNKLEQVFKDSIDAVEKKEQPYETLSQLIRIEKSANGKKKGPGTRAILELLHVLNYAQSLFEELTFNESKFIYNEYFPSEDENSPDSSIEPDYSAVFKRTEEKEDSFGAESEDGGADATKSPLKCKSLRRCAYDAYLSSLAPKHNKTIQYAVWTASFSLPSRKTAYSRVYKLPKEESEEEFELLLPLIRKLRKDLHLFILQDMSHHKSSQ